MRPGSIKHVPFAIFLLLAAAAGAIAQTTGVLEGLVFDPSGRVIPGVSIDVVDLGLGITRHLETDSRGRFQAPSQPPGKYRIAVRHPGFRGEIQEPVDLAAGRVVQLEFHLQIGEQQESVLVESEAPLLSIGTTDWGGSVERRKLEDSPLRGRDLFDLSAQTPGVVVTSSAKLDLVYGYGIKISVNGNRPSQNGFRLDGVYINDAAAAAPASAAGVLLGVEGVSELRIVSSPFSAEYGRAAGALITAVSKSGSNQLHGSVYEYLRNDSLDARNFFDPAGQGAPPLRRNQFGGSLGGPIRENNLFYFANYEGIRSSSGKTQTSTTMNAAAREGILPTRTVMVADSVKPYMDLYPLPNGRDFGDGTGEFHSEISTDTREDMVTGRLDYYASEKLRFFGRYTFDDAESSTNDPFLIWTFPSDSRYQFVQADAQYLQSSRTIHALRFGFSRVRNSDRSEVRSDIPPSLSFVPGQTLGVIEITGLTPLGGLQARLRPRRFALNAYQFSYDGTYIRGSHTLRAGGSFDRIQFNQRNDNNPVGRYNFTSLPDFLEARTNYGDMMLPESDTNRGWRQSLFTGFFQDDYRIGQNISATVGVRYEGYTTPSEVNGKVATIPDPLHDTGVTVGGPLFVNPSETNFAPRAALAWDPWGEGKTVIRAGAGIFYDLLGTRELSVVGARMPPFFSRASVRQPTFPNLYEAVQNATPEYVPDTLEYRPKQPYTIQYQLSVEQRLAANIVMRSTYAGTRGVHLIGQVGNINTPVPVLMDDGRLFFPAGAPRLNPSFGRIIMRRMAFNSHFHAMHLELERRLSRRWGFQAKYSWGKSIDESSTTIFTDFLTSDQLPTMFNYKQNRGLSDFDSRHIFAANFSVQLPSLDSGAGKYILGGWQIHGLVQAQSGYAFSPFTGFDRTRINPGSEDLGQRPDLSLLPGTELILGSPDKYFNDLAFNLQEAGYYGNLGRNALTGPGRTTVDVALHKEVWRSDRQTVKLRVEAFNVANHPNFQVPSGLALFNSSLKRVGSAGRITSTSTPSRQIQLALRWTF